MKAAGAQLETLWNAPAFSVAGVTYDGLDAALSAMARGDWAHFEHRLAHGIACSLRARAEKTPPSAHDLEEAAIAFRYDRDLLAASDVNDWLERVGLLAEEWTGYLERDLLRQRWHDSLDHTLDGYPPSSQQLAAAAYAEGVCSGFFDQMVEDFAARVALTVQHESHTEASTLHNGKAARLARIHAHWLEGRPPAETHARLARVLSIETAFADAVERVMAQAALDDIVQQHRLHWLQVEIDTLRFTAEHAAREAVLCITLDRLSLHDVAALARRSAERSLHFADELDPEQRDLLLGVTPGSIVGPLGVNGHFEVSAVVRRMSPSLDDPRVMDRARGTVLDAALRRASRDLVVRHARA